MELRTDLETPISLVKVGSKADPDRKSQGQNAPNSANLGPTQFHFVPNRFLSKLLEPVLIEEFFDQYREKKPFIKNSRSALNFQEYFSLNRLRELTTLSAVRRREFMRLWNSNQIEIPIATVQHKFKNLAEHFFRQKGSITLNHLQTLDPKCSELCKEFESALGTGCVVNAYLTPAHSQTFPCHWEDHDVFVLQIEGEKTWSIYEPVLALPLSGQEKKCLQKPRLLQQVTLKEGSWLYLPRGYPHEAQTEERFSLHLTVGCYPTRRFDLLKEIVSRALEKCGEDPDFRYSSSDREFESRKDSPTTGFEKLVSAFLEEVRIQSRDTQLLRKERLKRKSLSPEDQQSIWQTHAALTSLLDHEFQVTDEEILVERKKELGRTEVYFRDEKLIVPSALDSALGAILDERTLRFNALRAPLIGTENLTQLVEGLLRLGVLSIKAACRDSG